ncbi:NAD(P)H-dependent glycerol-3-phosphate dehydrogenase [Bathycoccus prasinos]|uniref:Glycerol-3-phosphate dehydrogenase [NAD(+)] n=1 Tax=Bathycoccus prasinos TaxID=41875 RepID=K8EIV0_9CHLO|nr:NAD(P)H-dependent glycerol-3-phosphate dehydrogenase [Bathycoccus prasinos]CCO17909.1 NAD(P)H-dependent glycerol-3-phosphate dehydrogenase [Bathycoccus prasinos]|eukprot:XP_007511788.1 NAD(P)H-dependent glycerol-3-phosphate dehydrogenase [Bathycoccus prasinos]
MSSSVSTFTRTTQTTTCFCCISSFSSSSSSSSSSKQSRQIGPGGGKRRSVSRFLTSPSSVAKVDNDDRRGAVLFVATRTTGTENTRKRCRKRGVYISPCRASGAYEQFLSGITEKDRKDVSESWEKIMRWKSFVESANKNDEDVLANTKKVTIMGGGSFGTAMGTLLARNKSDLDVVLLLRNEQEAETINATNRNAKYLPKYELPKNIRATTDAKEALKDSDFIIHAVPTQHSRKFLSSVKDIIDPKTPLLCLSKGLEVGSSLMMSEVIPEALERDQPLCVLSGPTFAVELMQGLPTGIVAASENEALARRVQSLYGSSCLRVNTSTDVVGVEMSGALKNVLAIAAGIVEGLELGNNAMAALVAQGCAEIRWLAGKLGAKSETLAGLSGTGDIMLTCFVNLSRNRTVGSRLGSGETLEEILGSMNQVAEGVATAGAVVQLARKHRVSLPVLTAVARILEGDVDPKDAVDQIMNLPQVPEV